MFKIILCILIVFMFGYIGILLSNNFKERYKQLYFCELMLNRVISYLRHENTPTKELFEKLSNISPINNLTFITYCSKYLSTGMNFSTAFNMSLEKSKKDLCLSNDDFQSISNLSLVIGASDVETQINSINSVKEQIIIYKNQAHEILETNGRLYKKLGFMFGIAVSILFI